jgi:general nucleoside transport system permease protein
MGNDNIGEKILKIIKSKSFYVPIASIILGLIIGSNIVIIFGGNPILVLENILKSIGSLKQLGRVLMATTPLIFTGLAVGFAFRTGLFNIGVEGQFIAGRFAAFIVALVLANAGFPPFFIIVFAMVASMIAGGLWGAVPGYLKARFGIHEVIVTIMMNWIALYLSSVAVNEHLKEPGELPKTVPIPEGARISNDALTNCFDTDFHIGIFIALAIVFIVYILLFKTTIGFELRAVGFNPKAAEYSGMNVKKNLVMSFVISGALGGLAGAIQIMAGQPSFRLAAESIMPGYGFNGIAASLIGNNHPVGIIFGAFILGIFEIARSLLQVGPGYSQYVIDVIIGVIIFFIAAGGIITMISDRFKKKRYDKLKQIDLEEEKI